jgi:hypothetical protein
MASKEEIPRAKATLLIEIKDTCLETAVTITIELDVEANKEQTCFTPGQQVYLRVYTEPQGMQYTIGNTYGAMVAHPEKDGLSEHEEYIEVVDGVASLGYPLNRIISVEWWGRVPCPIATVQFMVGQRAFKCGEGACSSSPEDYDTGICKVTYGVLKIKYNSLFKSYAAIANKAGKILIYAYEYLTGDVVEV